MAKVKLRRGYITEWEDLGDLCNPLLYLRSIMGYMNDLHSGHENYSKEAHERMKQIYTAVAQRTLREITKEDEDRFRELQPIEGM